MDAKGECTVVKTYDRTEGAKQLSTNFRVQEFRCKCGRCDKILIDDALIHWLQKLRDHFGTSIHVNSGYRCPAHNGAVGGSETSHHMRGQAADIRVKGVAPKVVAAYAESIGIQRIGLYEGAAEGDFVHVGSDTRKRFWLGHAGLEVNSFAVAEVELPVLHKRDKGGAVWGLQALLLGYGYDLGNKGLDGSFGAATEKALRTFQHEHDLTVTAVTDRYTWSELLGLQ